MNMPAIETDGSRACQDPLTYYRLLTTKPKPCSPVALWLRNLIGRFL
jgi:hypothetical protein